MEGGGRGLAQLAVQQELRARYGIKVKRRPWKEKEGTVARSRPGAGKVFGIALHKLPHQAVPEYGRIPCFLVEACEYLEEYIHTEGLFRKSGSVVRLKALKCKLDQGEICLSEAQPCDVAGLLKQFFRELPEPVFPNDLQEAFIKAQHLDTEKKDSATLLLSCLLDDRTSEALRYFFSFLQKVSLRSTENKMDSSNLAVIFAPNLLLSSEADKISAQTNKKLGLQVAVVQALIDHAEDIGNVPKYILDKMPVMLGVDDPVSTPLPQNYGESEGETPGERKRRRRRSLGVFPSVTPVLVTPSTKRKYPADSVQGFSNKKMRSLRHNLALELLPNSVFNSSTPASAQFEATPCMSLEASQSLLSTSVTSDMQSVGSRRSKRIASKKVQRVESGKMGCFSPKVSRKEMVRRSLRLKFLLGKSSKENAVVEHPTTKRSETIGRRLASQTETENGTALVQTVVLSPRVGKSITKKGTSKNISKSEENLQMANCSNEASFRISWTGCCTTEPQETYNSTYLMANLETCSSEPALTTRKAAVVPTICRLVDGTTEQNSNGQQNSFCEDESNSTTRTLLKIKRAFSESGSNLHHLLETEPPELNLTCETVCISGLDLKQQLSESPAQKMTAVEQKPLFTSSVNKPSVIDKHLSNTDEVNSRERSLFPITTETNSLLLDLSGSDGLILEDHVPGVPSPGIHENSTETLELTLQSTPENISEDKELRNCNSEGGTKETLETRGLLSKLEKGNDGSGNQYLSMETHEKPSPPGKVADHIHWFNKLSLNEPCSVARTKSPLKFQRTPVRQSVRRMNSLLEGNKHSTTSKLKKPDDGSLSLEKSVSHETVLLSQSETVSSIASTSHDQLARSSVSCPQLTHPVQQAGRPDTTCKVKSITANQYKPVLEDRTNHEIPKTVVTMNINLNNSVPTPDRCAVRKLSVEKKTRYRGSPKNPIATAKLLTAIKPLDF